MQELNLFEGAVRHGVRLTASTPARGNPTGSINHALKGFLDTTACSTHAPVALPHWGVVRCRPTLLRRLTAG